jgi:hypothetical protein
MRSAAFVVARRAWRRDLVSLLLVGALGGGAVGTAAALLDGAERTQSAFNRFVASAHDVDTGVVVNGVDDDTIAHLRSLPGVRAAMLSSFGGIVPQLDDDTLYLPTLIDWDGAYGHDIQRGRLLRGRFTDPGAPNEVTLDEPLAERVGLDVGDTLHVGSLTPHQLDLERRGETQTELRGPSVDLEVVGIVRQPYNLLTDQPIASFLAMTPAFGERYGDRIGEWNRVLLLDLGGPGDDPSVFVDALHAVPGFEETQLATLLSDAPIQPTLDFTATLMRVLAAAVAVAGLGAAGLALARALAVRASDDGVLAALGATRRGRALVHLAAVGPAALAGAAVAVASAAAASSFLPFGLARRADPDLGVRIDLGFVVAGVALLVLAAGVLALAAGLRASRGSEATARAETAGLVARLRRVAVPVPALVGVGLAFDRRRGAARVPTRTAVAGVVVGTASLLMATVVAASVDHLLASPEAQGFTWDVKLDDDAPVDVVDAPGVVAAADVRISTVEVDGLPLEVRGIDVLRGDPPQRLLDGRAATGPREIVLGTRTMDALSVGVGDTVHVGDGAAAEPFRVVGRGVFAGLSDLPLSGDGGSMRGDELWRLVEGSDDEGFVTRVVDLAPGTDAQAMLDLIEASGVAPGDHAPGTAADEPVAIDIERLHSIEDFPWALTVFLGAVALVAVGHATVSLVRRRRHDIAVLQSVGLGAPDIRRSVVVQAVVVAAAGLVVGAPLGLALGNVVWRRLAGAIGVPAAVEFPWLLVAAVPLAVVAVVAALALVPARRAARTRPAAVLRAE